ncbi:MAG: 4-phosphoerythronate dehydrogenase [Prevotellaceae bacterium]|jgi:erythronate-4-phosphate dehydrogenase|nr:4-phosphoerythronate dehydrogenase [Prevotellaceae bacterium]
MKIVIDDKIPFINGVFEPFADVVYKAGDEISRIDLLDADALVTRTRTICNAKLLEGTEVKFIASTTIGFDHIDADFCNRNNIAWTNAAGCNSLAVAQYVLAALLQISLQRNINLNKTTIGIIGVGNVGKKVENICMYLGMNILLCDAPRKKNEENTSFADIDKIAENADIVTLHVPLNRIGEYKTYHLFDDKMFEMLKAKILINTSRGEIVETNALKSAIKNGKIDFAVIDVWENEPKIDKNLLSLVDIATPHIAGYSLEGKAAGTAMAVRAISKFFNLGLENWQVKNLPEVEQKIIVDCADKSVINVLQDVVKSAYNIMSDNDLLKLNVDDFEKLRSNYRLRREFASHKIFAKNITEAQKKILNLLDFNVIIN